MSVVIRCENDMDDDRLFMIEMQVWSCNICQHCSTGFRESL